MTPVVSIFSGIGGFDLGFERAGFQVIAQCEWDANCQTLLASKFPALIIPDVRAIAATFTRIQRGHWFPGYEKWSAIIKRLSSALVWCGGFPCQDLSVAGARAGLAGERSGLWFAFRRLVALFRPPWVIIENVPGLLSSQGGRDLAIILGGLAQLGYRWAYRVLDAQYFGLAQRRERVFIVASLGGFSCAEVLFESESVCGDSAPSRQTWEGVAGTLGSRTENGGQRTTDLDGHGASDGPDESRQNLIAQFPQMNQGSGGNRSWIGSHDPHETLTRKGKPNAVLLAFPGRLSGTQAARAEDISPVLQSKNPMAIAFTQNTRDEVREINGDGSIVGALSAERGMKQQPYLAEIVGTLRADAGAPKHEADLTKLVTHHSAVRRLTPRECERLQGFPDDWTEGFSDSARCRMLGNAIAVPCAEWIAKRLMAHIQRVAS